MQILVRADQAQAMPWKNGGGATTQLLAWPPDADLTNFQWRISVALIERDGPFSRFPGMDRSLVLLHGDGMELDFDDRCRQVTPANPRVDFAGELDLECRLLGAATRDLNLIWRRQAGACELSALDLHGQRHHSKHDEHLAAIYVCQGAWRNRECVLHPGDLLVADELELEGHGSGWLMRLTR